MPERLTSLVNIYFHLSGFQSSLLLIHFLQSECLAVHTALYQSLAQCHPVAGVQIVERGVPMAGSELNRTRGKRGGKRAKIGVRAISCPSLPSLSSFFFVVNISPALYCLNAWNRLAQLKLHFRERRGRFSSLKNRVKT